MSSRQRLLPSLRTVGSIVATALAIMPRHAHGILESNRACMDQMNQANVTGTTSFGSEQVSAFQKSTAGGPGNMELSWTVTLNSPPSAGVEDYRHTIWLGTPPDINLNDGKLPFSACAMVFTDLPYNTILRANTAPSGDCTATFDSNCVDALVKRAEDVADSLTQGCTPGANSNCSISEICPTIFSQLGTQKDMPQECVPYFDVGTDDRAWPSANISAITTNVGDHSETECAIVPKGHTGYTYVPQFRMHDDNKKFTNDANANIQSYDNLTALPYPILTVFMPPANGTRSSASVTPASAQMRCLHADTAATGSRAIAKLPAPTPVYIPGTIPPLTPGAIAGIVIGVLVFVALLVLAGFYFWRQRQRARDRREATRAYGGFAGQQPSMTSGLVASGSVLTTSTRSGALLSSQNSVRHEAPSQGQRNTVIAELPHDAPTPRGAPAVLELNGADNPTEMAAQEARVRQSMMSGTSGTPASAWPRDFHRDTYAPPLPAVPSASELSSPQASTRGAYDSAHHRPNPSSEYNTLSTYPDASTYGGVSPYPSSLYDASPATNEPQHSAQVQMPTPPSPAPPPPPPQQPQQQQQQQQQPPQPPHQWGSAWSSAAAAASLNATNTASPAAHQRDATHNAPPLLPPLRTSTAPRGWMTPVERKDGDAF